jgi:sec-independent protein translocase protein TatB
MFANFGFGEMAILAMIGLVVFGPERLPKAAIEAVQIIRKLRSMADSTVKDFKAELPPGLADLDPRSLDPRRIITSALFDSDEPAKPAPPS